MRSAAAWFKAVSAAEDPVRTLEGLFSGSLWAGKNSRPPGAGASFEPAASAAARDFSLSGSAASGGSESSAQPMAQASGVDREGPAFGAAALQASAALEPTPGLDTRGRAFTPFESAARNERSDARQAAASPAPPRSLRLAFAGVDARGTAMELRILESGPAPTLSLGAESVADAAVALQRAAQASLAVAAADRLLDPAAAPPAPAWSSDHGWLAYWTAAAASRVLIARN